MTNHAERHLAVAASVSHSLRNYLAPAQLRLDAWMLGAASKAIGHHEFGRVHGLLQEMAQLIDGLELLRLSPVDHAPICATPWPVALRAVLNSIANGTSSSFELVASPDDDALAADTDAAHLIMQHVPALMVAHVVCEIALHVKDAAPDAAARYRVAVNNTIASLRADFTNVATAHAPPLARSLETAVQRIFDQTGVRYSVSVGCRTADDQSARVHCRVDLPTVDGATSGAPSTSTLDEQRPFSVLCIDDSESLLDALESRLQLTSGFTHFVRSQSVAEAIEFLKNDRVSLILVDVHLSVPHDPFASIRLLRAECPDARIALFSGSADPDYMERAASNGADGFICKGAPSHQLVDAIVRLARGERVWLDAES